MKNVITIVLLIVAGGFLNSIQSQTFTKGQYSAGLNFLAMPNSIESGSSQVAMNLSFAYYIKDDLGLGLEAFGMTFGEDFRTFTFNPYVKYYFKSNPFFAQLGLAYSSINIDGDGDSQINLNLSAGYAFQLSDKVIIEPTVRIIPAGGQTVFAMGIGVQFILN